MSHTITCRRGICGVLHISVFVFRYCCICCKIYQRPTNAFWCYDVISLYGDHQLASDTQLAVIFSAVSVNIYIYIHIYIYTHIYSVSGALHCYNSVVLVKIQLNVKPVMCAV